MTLISRFVSISRSLRLNARKTQQLHLGAIAALILTSLLFGLYLSPRLAVVPGLLAMIGLFGLSQIWSRNEDRMQCAAPPDPAHDTAGQEADEIETELLKSLQTGAGLSIVYQPVIAVGCRRIHHAEALVRWRSPMGEIGPDVFVPIAEKSGAIRALSEWVLERVALELSDHPQIDISVNLSPLVILEQDFPDRMTALLSQRGVPASQVEIELTEGACVTDPGRLTQALHRLKSLGFRIALDDYGSGFASLGYIKRIDFDTLKLDKTLVIDGLSSKRSRILLDATLAMARALNLRTIAEGVETRTQHDVLAGMGLDMLQGYFCGSAVPIRDLAKAVLAQDAPAVPGRSVPTAKNAFL